VNLAELRTRVYDILEEDSEGVSESLIDLFAQDGYDRVVGADRKWPWFQSTTTLTTYNGTQSYTPPLKEVSRLIRRSTGGGEKLTFMDHADALEMFDSATGEPYAFSVWGHQIHLWPVPASTEELTVVGYRQPNDWQANPAVEIDIDSEFHMAILYWTLSRYYARIEDTEISAFYEQMFVTGVTTAQQAIKSRNTFDFPLILSGGTRNRSSSSHVLVP
jgi:hypothetical protein